MNLHQYVNDKICRSIGSIFQLHLTVSMVVTTCIVASTNNSPNALFSFQLCKYKRKYHCITKTCCKPRQLNFNIILKQSSLQLVQIFGGGKLGMVEIVSLHFFFQIEISILITVIIFNCLKISVHHKFPKYWKKKVNEILITKMFAINQCQSLPFKNVRPSAGSQLL